MKNYFFDNIKNYYCLVNFEAFIRSNLVCVLLHEALLFLEQDQTQENYGSFIHPLP